MWLNAIVLRQYIRHSYSELNNALPYYNSSATIRKQEGVHLTIGKIKLLSFRVPER
jgi:hypothetical protein